MLTWMTRASFLDSARDLDDDLLTLTAQQSARLLDAMTGGEPLPKSTPLESMWASYEVGLAGYSLALMAEAGLRGIVIFQSRDVLQIAEELGGEFVRPPWVDDTAVLRSHRSNAVRRWPGKYKKVWGPKTPKAWPYLWPIVDDEGGYEIRLSKHDKGLLKSGARSLPDDVLERIASQ